MNTFFERYKAFIIFTENFLRSLVHMPHTTLQFVGQIIFYFILIVALLVFFSFTGLLEDPTGILIPFR